MKGCLLLLCVVVVVDLLLGVDVSWCLVSGCRGVLIDVWCAVVVWCFVCRGVGVMGFVVDDCFCVCCFCVRCLS